MTLNWNEIRLRVRYLIVLAYGLVVATTLGCGGGSSGPPRAELAGMVTYNGKPVPKGFITFSPDSAKGNHGPGAGAPIEGGRYVTPPEKGVVGGPHVVRIVGYDGVPTTEQGEELPDGKSLFTPFEVSVDLPKESGEQNFEIPAGK